MTVLNWLAVTPEIVLLGMAAFGHRRRRDVGSESTPATEESLS